MSEDEERATTTRRFCFLTVGEAHAPAPPGLIHTMALEDIGKYVLSEAGLTK